MKKRNFWIITFILCISVNLYSQKENDSISLKKFKKFLPYILTPESNNEYPKIDNRVSGVFERPWSLKVTSKKEALLILNEFIDKAKISTELDFKKLAKFKFSSTLKNINLTKFENLNIIVENFKISNSKNESILRKNTDGKKNNESKILNFNNRNLLKTFPITKEHDTIIGKINFSINEYREFSFKELSKTDKNLNFEIDDLNIKLLNIKSNKATFLISKGKIKDLTIVAINKKGEKYTTEIKFQLPKKVFDFKNEQDLSNKKIVNNFIKSLNYNDIFNSENILEFKTNGEIEKLFVYKKCRNLKFGKREYIINYKN